MTDMTSFETVLDVDAEVIPEHSKEVPTGNQETYSSAEIAAIIGVTDRTVRNYLKKVKEVYYWLPLAIGTRYSHQCLEMIKDLKTATDNGTSYQDYKAQVWSNNNQKGNNSSLVLRPDNRLATAETLKIETQHTINQQQSRFNGIRAMVRAQLKAQAELDATEDGKAYIETYMDTLNNVVSGHQELGK